MRDSFAETYSPSVGTTNINDWIDDDKKGEKTMVTIDFTKVEEAKESNLVLNGKYLTMIEKIEEGKAQTGTPYWAINYKIVCGKFTGKTVKDKLYFTEKAYGRVKKFFSALGHDVSGKFNCSIDKALNHQIMINVEQEVFEKEDGTKGITCRPTFAGFYPDDEYSEHYDKELYDPKLLQQRNQADDDDLIGDNEIPF